MDSTPGRRGLRSAVASPKPALPPVGSPRSRVPVRAAVTSPRATTGRGRRSSRASQRGTDGPDSETERAQQMLRDVRLGPRMMRGRDMHGRQSFIVCSVPTEAAASAARDIDSKLEHWCKNPLARRWAWAEWAYALADHDFFLRDRPLCCWDDAGIPFAQLGSALPRRAWSLVRAAAGRPRRYSPVSWLASGRDWRA